MEIFLIISQVLAVCVSTYLLLLERKYCRHCNWWSNTGALLLFITSLVPLLGLLTSIAESADCVRNIIEELQKENDRLNIELDKTKEKYKSIQTITANCITINKENSLNSRIGIAQSCICNEITKQLLPYIHFENYKIADSSGEMKHIGKIQVVKDVD